MFLIGATFLWVIFAPKNEARLTISNESGQTIVALEIGVSGHKKEIHALANGEKEKIQFQGLSDSHYTLNGSLHDGTPISGEFGYVTHSMNFDDSFLIKVGGNIEFESKPSSHYE